MRHLFSPEGEAALAAALSRRPLLAFDFDGTLAPIVSRPSEVRLSADMSALLAVLASRWPLAIVTGRSIADVRVRLGFEPRYIVGNHGAEFDEAVQGESLAAVLGGLRRRIREHADLLARAGVVLEDKGHSVAFHYRTAPARALALEAIGAVLGPGDPELRVFGGKMVVNVAPSTAPDKADAVMALFGRCGADCAVFAGDDVNDEPVFAAAPQGWLTVKVGFDDPASRAMFFVRDPDEVTQMVAKMVAVSPPAPPG